MIARATMAEIDPVRMSVDDAVELFRESVLPALHEQPGYEGSLRPRLARGEGARPDLLGDRGGADAGLAGARSFYAEQVEKFVTHLPRRRPGASRTRSCSPKSRPSASGERPTMRKLFGIPIDDWRSSSLVARRRGVRHRRPCSRCATASSSARGAQHRRRRAKRAHRRRARCSARPSSRPRSRPATRWGARSGARPSPRSGQPTRSSRQRAWRQRWPPGSEGTTGTRYFPESTRSESRAATPAPASSTASRPPSSRRSPCRT